MEASIIISVSSSIAAFITSGIALFNLLEIKRQRKQSSKPDIILCRTKWYTYSNGKDRTPSIWNNEIIEDTSILNDLSELNNFTFKICNIGLGPSRNITMQWDYDIQKFSDIIHKYNNDKLYRIEKYENKDLIKISYKSGAELIFIELDMEDSFEYILPVRNTNESLDCIKIPNSYKALLTALIDVQLSQTKGDELSKELMNIPILTLKISYFDISNNKYIKVYNIQPNVNAYHFTENIEKNKKYLRTHGNFEIKEIYIKE